VPPGLVKAWVDGFFAYDDKEKNWTSSSMKELMNKVGAMLREVAKTLECRAAIRVVTAEVAEPSILRGVPIS
jgi:hypothetical protein